MRERVRDKGRLEHILNAIDVLLKNKERYTYDEIVKVNDKEITISLEKNS